MTKKQKKQKAQQKNYEHQRNSNHEEIVPKYFYLSTLQKCESTKKVFLLIPIYDQSTKFTQRRSLPFPPGNKFHFKYFKYRPFVLGEYITTVFLWTF